VKRAPPGPTTSVSTASRVVPATGDTIDRSAPASALSRLLLPTLGRPMMATATGASPAAAASSGRAGGSAATRRSSRSPEPEPLMADTATGSRPSAQKSAACTSASATFSHLLTASSTGVPGCVRRSQAAISSSAAVTPACPSTTMTSTSASAAPAAACRSIACAAPNVSARGARPARRGRPATRTGHLDLTRVMRSHSMLMPGQPRERRRGRFAC